MNFCIKLAHSHISKTSNLLSQCLVIHLVFFPLHGSLFWSVPQLSFQISQVCLKEPCWITDCKVFTFISCGCEQKCFCSSTPSNRLPENGPLSQTSYLCTYFMCPVNENSLFINLKYGFADGSLICLLNGVFQFEMGFCGKAMNNQYLTCSRKLFEWPLFI